MHLLEDVTKPLDLLTSGVHAHDDCVGITHHFALLFILGHDLHWSSAHFINEIVCQL